VILPTAAQSADGSYRIMPAVMVAYKVRPADQCLHADYPAVIHLDLRLIMNLEFAIFERVPQIVAERKLPHCRDKR